MPIIWGEGVPLIFLDLVIEFYHHPCFPLYKIPLVEREKYIKIDRHRLKYLALHEKLGYDYCGYANGILFYASRIATETENY